MLAYVRSKTAAGNATGARWLPLVPIARAQWPLRSECPPLFARAGVAGERVLFADDLPLATLQALGEAERLSVVLVDHNSLGASRAWKAE